MAKETYLGDGLFAQFDGEQVKLRAPRIDRDHEVYIDQSIWLALNLFMKDNHLNWKVR